MEKPLETAWVGLKVGWGRALGYHQGGANSMNQAVGVSDMVPICPHCGYGGGGLGKGSVASFWEKDFVLVLTNSVPPIYL